MTNGVKIEAHVDGLQGLGQALQRLKALGERPASLWEAMGTYGENSTRTRFKTQTGPDGQSWLPSRRAKKTGGSTLQFKGHLLRSINHQSNSRGTEWGSNMKYAAIHQLGGEIKRTASTGTVRLRTTRSGALLRQKDHAHLGVFAKKTHTMVVERSYTKAAHSIRMPARPYLGVNAQDGRELLAIATEVVDLAARNRGAA